MNENRLFGQFNFRINDKGYLEKKDSGRHGKASHPSFRSWFLIIDRRFKFTLPKVYIGKKIRIKIELLQNTKRVSEV